MDTGLMMGRLTTYPNFRIGLSSNIIQPLAILLIGQARFNSANQSDNV